VGVISLPDDQERSSVFKDQRGIRAEGKAVGHVGHLSMPALIKPSAQMVDAKPRCHGSETG
jgi:hypothetical protein